MKKLLCLLLALILCLSLCACGGSEEDDGSIRSNRKNGGAQTQETVDIHSAEAYVGSWAKEKTDDSPFAMSMTLNADGTGSQGTKTTLEWSYDESADEISLILHYSDGSTTEPSTAKLQEDGTLCWTYTFSVMASDDSTFEVDQVIFDRAD